MFTEAMLFHLPDTDTQILREFIGTMKNFWAIIKEASGFFTWQMVLSLIAFVIGEIFCLKLMKLVIRIPSKTERKINRAVRRGRYTEAELDHVRNVSYLHYEGQQREYHYSYYGYYTYTVNGRTHKCSKGFHLEPPRTLTLYYPGRPGRTYHKNQLCFEPLRYTVYILLILMPVLLGAAVLYFLGGMPD